MICCISKCTASNYELLSVMCPTNNGAQIFGAAFIIKNNGCMLYTFPRSTVYFQIIPEYSIEFLCLPRVKIFEHGPNVFLECSRMFQNNQESPVHFITCWEFTSFPSQGRQVFPNEDYLHMSGGKFNNNSTRIRNETIPFRLSLSINKHKYKLRL